MLAPPGVMGAPYQQGSAAPSAPPLPPGYETLYPDQPLPYPTPSAPPQPPPQPRQLPEALALSEEEVREAVLDWVSSHCCYGSKPAKEMRIHGLEPASAFHYALEAFTESRFTAHDSLPYMGEMLDGPHLGAPPGPWEIRFPDAVQPFANAKLTAEVPRTSSIQPCHKCGARGRKHCDPCNGRGRKECPFCHGSGEARDAETGEYRDCRRCNGRGRQNCTFCGGDGNSMCKKCQGRCQLRHFIRLTAVFEVRKEEAVVNLSADSEAGGWRLPAEAVKASAGQTLLREEAPRLYPLHSFPLPQINQVSQSLCAKQEPLFTQLHVHAQRHTLRSVPVTRVHATVGGGGGETKAFYVHGLDRRVHFPDYPAKCCCGCTIL